MQPPIPAGTVLQGRYRLIQLLGQGGFGRTYLVEDQGRFNERCVVKEYIPVQSGTYALEKSKELFQREASILYQIQHPQVPRFHVTFEQGRRLFFVQDFIEGKTYGTLLEERIESGKVFSEAEALHLLHQMLPVLAYLHGKGIIHRDISPDNIMLRESDRLPVLIDFGVVKAVANQMQATEDGPQGTTVGKLGYAPNEQLQTGKAYPNSDLYALAVTVVVLLTGQKPQDLLDETTLTWHWQQRVPTLSPLLVQVLNRMLSPRPNNRYQSATEVSQVLRSLTGLVPPPLSPGTPPPAPPPSPETLPGVNTYSVKSVAKPVTPAATRSRSVVIAPPPVPLWRRPWVGWAIGFVLFSTLALGPWLVINSLLQNQTRTNNPSPSPSPGSSSPIASSPQPTPSPGTDSPVASPAPVVPGATPLVDAEPLTIPAGQTKAQVNGRTITGRVKRYLVNMAANQVLAVAVLQGAVALDVRSPDGQPLPGATGVTNWQSQPLATPGSYQVDVTAARDTDFNLEVTVQEATAVPSPGASPPASPTPPSTPPSPSPVPGATPGVPGLPADPVVPSPLPTP